MQIKRPLVLSSQVFRLTCTAACDSALLTLKRSLALFVTCPIGTINVPFPLTEIADAQEKL